MVTEQLEQVPSVLCISKLVVMTDDPFTDCPTTNIFICSYKFEPLSSLINLLWGGDMKFDLSPDRKEFQSMSSQSQ